MDPGLIIIIIILLFSAILHEIAHGTMALILGDPTAKLSGRLSLNPINHIDPFGTILLPIILAAMNLPPVGYAKPVPINPIFFSDKKYGAAKVALAGPGINLFIALVFGLLLRIFGNLNFSFVDSLNLAFVYIIIINLMLAIFNLMPIPPLDGHHILFALLPESAHEFKMALYRYQWLFIVPFLFIYPYIAWPILQFLFQLITGFSLPV